MKKHLHIVQELDVAKGGSVTAALSIMDVERELGIESQVLTLAKSGEFPDLVVHQVSRTFPKRVSHSYEAIRWLRRNVKNYDLVCLHSFWSFFHLEAAIICRLKGVPYVIWPHGSLDPYDLQKKKALKVLLGFTLFRFALSGATRVVCTSNTEADLLVTYGVNAAKAVAFLPVKPPKSYEDASSNDPSTIEILFLSRIDKKKNLKALIKAISILFEKQKNFRLVVAGDGDPAYVKDIKAYTNQLGVESQVNFLGFLTGDAKEEAFRKADLFALPSENENFGIAIIEALYRQLPILITKSVYIYDLILEDNAGWITTGAAEDIAEILSNATPKTLLTKKANARAAAEQFAPESVKTSYIQLFNDAYI